MRICADGAGSFEFSDAPLLECGYAITDSGHPGPIQPGVASIGSQPCRAYEKEKHRAQELYPNDSPAYADEKSAWIRNMEAKALIWLTDQPIGTISN
jgi:hypothetical protein